MKYLPIVWILLSVSACKNATETKTVAATPMRVFKQTIDSIFAPTDANGRQPVAYIILPNSGCGGCISSAEQLLTEYGKNKLPLRFILTNISSFKEVKNNFGDSVVSSPAVYPDHDNIFYLKNPSFDQIYPAIVYVDKTGEPVRMEYINPGNAEAIPRLHRYVDSATAAKPIM
jgi:hypothetical protein